MVQMFGSDAGHTYAKQSMTSTQQRCSALAAVCPVCSATFHTRSFSAVYCSVRCRMRAYRHRNFGNPLQPISFDLPTRSTPLVGPRPSDADLIANLQTETSETLQSIQFELELLNDPGTPPLVKAVAEELHATAQRLARLAVALEAVQ